MTVRRALAALLLLAAIGCGGGCGGRGPADDEPAPPGGSGTGTPLVVLVRYGGLAGHNDRVSVEPSGVATVVGDRSPAATTRTLTPGELTTLRTALERSEISTLQRNYLDPRAADAYQYDVTYQGVTVTADEGVLPPKLKPVVEQLARLLAG